MSAPGYSAEATPAGTDWFTTTHWSVVLNARDPVSPLAADALETLCRSYWYPLYVYVRRQGCSPEDAQDLTQGFFTRVLESDFLDRVDRDKGRFRAYLLAALKNFLSDQRDRDRAAKRGGGKTIFSLDGQMAEERYQQEPSDPMSPDKLYERRWAFTVIEEARARLRDEFTRAGKSDLYRQLDALESGEDARTYAEVGRALNMSESAVKTAVVRSRRRYGELLREVIAQTVRTASEIDQEIQHLLVAIAT